MNYAEKFALVSMIVIFLCFIVWSFFGTPTNRLWSGGAWAAFIDGFIDSAPTGSSSGAALAVFDGSLHADLALKHVLIELAHILAAPVAAGLADVRAYKKDNPFPNPFATVPAPAARAVEQILQPVDKAPPSPPAT
jgi:hypothetical protein